MTVLRDAYVFDTGPIEPIPEWMYVPAPVVPGYTDATRPPIEQPAAYDASWWLDKMNVIGSIVILIVLVIIPGVLPLFI